MFDIVVEFHHGVSVFITRLYRRCAAYSAIAFLLVSCQVSAPELLKHRRFQEAYDLLIAAEEANPTDWEVKRQIARALGGWFEFSETGEPVPVLGLDKPIEAYRKFYGDPTNSYRVWATRPAAEKYSLEYNRFMWECFWFAKQAGREDGKFESTAASFYRKARSTDDFAWLRAKGAEGEEIYRYFQANR
ncbi:hypothetical protein N8467_00170 [bacterium]|nr:hypothetical protein [bacterium]